MAGYSTPAWTNNAQPAINASNLLAMGRAIELAQHPYGVCSTAAATASKTVTLDVSGTVSLFTGMTVRVKFTNGNTAANPTLNVNSTGAVAIKYYGIAPPTSWGAGAVLTLTYDGTSWCTTAGSAKLSEYKLASYANTVTLTLDADLSCFTKLTILVYTKLRSGAGSVMYSVYAGADDTAQQISYGTAGTTNDKGVGKAEVYIVSNTSSGCEVFSTSIGPTVYFNRYIGAAAISGTTLSFIASGTTSFDSNSEFVVYGSTGMA